MKMTDFAKASGAALMALGLLGCAPQNSGNMVNASQAQAAQSVSFGKITGAEPVSVQGGNKTAEVVGTLAGGLVGGPLGNEVGKGRGQDIATVAGATAGAAAGNRVAGAATTIQSTQWSVLLDDGRTIAVIQAEPVFSMGQRVQVVQSADGTTRLTP
jgi:outer membrane lipoprotein SlyB